MNKINMIYAISICLMIVVFSGRDINKIDDKKAADKIANQIFKCLNNDDVEALKSLFCQNVSNSHNLDEEIKGVFEFFEGEVVSYDDFNVGFSREKVEYGEQILLAIEPWITNIKTDSGKVYEMSFFAYVICEEDEDKVGIGGLKIIAEDETEYLVGDW